MYYDYSYLWLDLLNTIVMYMFFPIIYRIKKGGISEEKAKKIALINSIVIALIFIILKSASNSEGGAVVSGAPAFLYYYINKWYLSKPDNFKSDCIVGLFFSVACGITGWFAFGIPLYLLGTFIAYNCYNYSSKSIRTISVIIFYIMSFLLFIIVFYNFFESGTTVFLSLLGIGIVITVNTVAAKRKIVKKKQLKGHYFKCSECGGMVSENAIKCPRCGEIFEDDEKTINKQSHATLTVDDKYNELNKLKQLLDKEIINQEEFEKEKKKILK